MPRKTNKIAVSVKNNHFRLCVFVHRVYSRVRFQSDQVARCKFCAVQRRQIKQACASHCKLKNSRILPTLIRNQLESEMWLQYGTIPCRYASWRDLNGKMAWVGGRSRKQASYIKKCKLFVNKNS